MKQTFTYSLKVWLTSVILGSFISALPDVHHSTGAIDSTLQVLGTTLFFMCIAAPLSLCSWLLLFLFTFMFTKQIFEVTKAKKILSPLGLILALAPLLWLFGGTFNKDVKANLPLIAYPACLIAGIWFYKLEPASKPETIVNL